jgi:hypothetical protein
VSSSVGSELDSGAGSACTSSVVVRTTNAPKMHTGHRGADRIEQHAISTRRAIAILGRTEGFEASDPEIFRPMSRRNSVRAPSKVAQRTKGRSEDERLLRG